MTGKDEGSKGTMSVLIGAAFLMATSAIGPGFLTQTSVFSEKLLASFGFVILISVLIDIVVQVNVWRILGVSGMRAQDLSNKVLPGLGYFLAFVVALGGLFFNVGNVGGGGMGLKAIADVPHWIGVMATALIAIFLFLYKELGDAMDRSTKMLGIIMIVIVLIVVVRTSPPIGLAIKETFVPSQIDWFSILTLVGGTVGGYITFAGAHRIIDAGIVGKDNIGKITKGSIDAIAITTVMRYLLFLAILGAVVTGVKLDPADPAADAFRHGAGEVGYRAFGVILWAASVTSVVGASYTSVSFLRTLAKPIDENYRGVMIGFIVISTVINVTIGHPAKILVVVGTLNGLILPLSLLCVLLASRRKDLIGDYRHPLFLTIGGYIMVAFTAWMGVRSFGNVIAIFH